MSIVTPERTYIAFFGVRNAGKSSLVNAVTGQTLSIVSDIKGTTTDPVYKTMELLPIGPVMIIDTPGIDDSGALGSLRAARARETLRRTDIAVLVVSAEEGLQNADRDLIRLFEDKKIPYLVVVNKTDLWGSTDKSSSGLCNGTDGHRPDPPAGSGKDFPEEYFRVSALTGKGVWELKEKIAWLAVHSARNKKALLVEDLAGPEDLVVLVTPIDESAPKGRLILPQQMVIRAVLDQDAIPVVTKETTYAQTLKSLAHRPKLVITDSQAFREISALTPGDIPLTSFSILMARYKGLLDEAVFGAGLLDKLKEGDRILMAEGCTHHRQCNDLGTVKLPAMIRRYIQKGTIPSAGKKEWPSSQTVPSQDENGPEFVFTSGRTFPEDLSSFRLIIHCGGCMLNEQEMQSRAAEARAAGVPMTNYGTVLAKLNGILDRATEML